MDPLLSQQVVAPDLLTQTTPAVPVPDSLAAAIAHYRQTVESSDECLVSRSVAAMDYSALLQQSQRLLVNHPDDAQVLYQQGDALANLGRYPEALQSFQQVLELAPERVDAWVFQAVTLIHLERYEEALQSAEQAIALQPNHEEAWTFKGVALRYLGRCREAYASYDRALGIERPSFWQWLAQTSQGVLRRLSR